MKKIVLFLLTIILVLLCISALSEVKEWSTMPNFKVKTLDGSTFELNKVLKEKDLVLIDMWHIDCIGCPATTASLHLIYDQYKDRVAFLSLNPIDSLKAVKLYDESRGFTIPTAQYSNARSWSIVHPWFILLDKNRLVLYSMIGDQNPESVAGLLDWGLSLTPEEKQEFKEWKMSYGMSYEEFHGTPEEEKRRDAYINGAAHVYNMKNDMSMVVSGKTVSKIIVEDNIEILQKNEEVGEFYIIEEGSPFTVTIVTEKSFKPDKAYLLDINWNDLSDLKKQTFKKAKRDKNKYTFEFNDAANHDQILIFESGEWGKNTTDSMLGMRLFRSEDEAAQFFLNCQDKYAYEFNWSIAQKFNFGAR